MNAANFVVSHKYIWHLISAKVAGIIKNQDFSTDCGARVVPLIKSMTLLVYRFARDQGIILKATERKSFESVILSSEKD